MYQEYIETCNIKQKINKNKHFQVSYKDLKKIIKIIKKINSEKNSRSKFMKFGIEVYSNMMNVQ